MRKIIVFLTTTLLILGCSKDVSEGLADSYQEVDSIKVVSDAYLSLNANDTAYLDMEVYPASFELNTQMLADNTIVLEKQADKRQSGGGKNIPEEYRIVDIKKREVKGHNQYRIYIKDVDAGHGYSDEVKIAVSNKDGSKITSTLIKIANSGLDVYEFYLSDGKYDVEAFLFQNDTIHIQVPNTFDLEHATAKFKHNGKFVSLEEIGEISSGTQLDFSDFCDLHKYTIHGFDGNKRNYAIKCYNLPLIFISTPDAVEINSKEEWIGNSSFVIRDTDGEIFDYGDTNVKGRGNWSWRVGRQNGKKPYAIKLSEKPKDKTVLGMSGHKRWVLLANPLDYLTNPVGYEINRRLPSKPWAPRSRFVELFLNGTHRGLYLLAEQIRIDKNRVNITELKKTDNEGEAVTGGYLISYDSTFDEDPKFRSQYYNMPVMIKNPDAEDISDEQLNYITKYINDMEYSFYNDDKLAEGAYEEYIDVDSWIDYYFLQELWRNYEIHMPRSVWMYKDRGGKMVLGPGWDYEEEYFSRQKLYVKDRFYYKRFFQDRKFVERVQKRWPDFKASLVGNGEGSSILSFVDSVYNSIKYSARRDRMMTPYLKEFYSYPPTPLSTADEEHEVMMNGILPKVEWLEQQIMNW